MAIARTIILIALTFAAPDQNRASIVFFGFTSDSFFATGRWASTSPDPKDQPPYPEEVEIDCSATNHECIEATAEYYMGDPHISTDYYGIVKWDKNGILASSSDAACMTQTLLINFADRTVLATDSPKKLDDKTKSACEFFGAKGTQSWIFVLKGSDRWNKERLKPPPRDK